jgi:hypothetical protein
MRRGMSAGSIRKMRKEDIAAAGKIRKSITKRKAPRNWEKEVLVRLEDKENQCYVATSGKDVVGFILGETKTLDFGVDKSARWDSTDLLSFFKSIGFERSEFINLERRMKK